MSTADDEGEWILDETKNAVDWYCYAAETGDDSIAKFMMYWIAFNWLYSKENVRGDRLKIRQYCSDNYRILNRYKPWRDSPEAFKVFDDGPVLNLSGDQTHPTPEQLYESVHTRYGKIKVTSLLTTIYQVRCNLFHGSKQPRDTRDRELIKSSAVIMERYLWEVLADSNRHFVEMFPLP